MGVKNFIKKAFQKYKWRTKLTFDMTCEINMASTFEGANKIYPHTFFSGSMGYGTYIASNCEISAHIGRFTSIAPHVKTNNGVHPYTTPYATTCPMFYSTQKQNGHCFATTMMFKEQREIPKIGNDVWIGENVFLVGGITIGDGAVILAGAVITKNVPPYAIVGGVPAKILKYRYNEETIDFLLHIKWWNNSVEWLKENWKLMTDINMLKKNYCS